MKCCVNIRIALACFFTIALCQNTLTAQDSATRQQYLVDSIGKAMDSVFNDEQLFGIKSFWLADLNFLSNNVYFGRKDSIVSPYLTAAVSYNHKSGLFFGVSASYLTETGEGRVDLGIIDAGYTLITPKFEGLITASKYFFNDESYNVRSEIKGGADLFTAYDLGLVKPTLQLSLNFGNNTDYAVSFGIEHAFRAFHKSLTITPMLVGNAGTENFYNSYYEFRRYAIRRILKKFPKLDSTISAHIQDPSDFKILDYEFSCPIIYFLKKFSISFLPTLAVAVNPATVQATVTRNNGSIIKVGKEKEKLHNSLYFTAGVSYSF